MFNEQKRIASAKAALVFAGYSVSEWLPNYRIYFPAGPVHTDHIEVNADGLIAKAIEFLGNGKISEG